MASHSTRTRRPGPRTGGGPAAVARRAGSAVALAALLLAASACGGDGGSGPTADGSAEPSTAAPTATAEETPTETPTETPPEEPTPEATGVVLSAAGVGDVPMGTPDPRAALEALLGPAEWETPDLPCGPGDVDALQWGALSVSTLEGALWGWDINPGRGALPAGVVVESGVTPYQPLADALALPGASGPDYLESLDLLYVEAGGVQYYGSGADAATSEIQITGVNVITCG